VDDHRPPNGADAGDGPVVSYEASSPAGAAPDGPPPPPFVRERRRRRHVALAIAAALVVIGIPIGLAIASALAERDDPVAALDTDGDRAPNDDDGPAGDGGSAGDGGTADDDGSAGSDSDDGEVADPDAGADPDGGDADAGPDEGADGGPSNDPGGRADPTLTPPDVDALDGLDAAYAQLLLDIDASELTMIGFQEDVREVVVGAGSPADAVAAVSAAAGERADELGEVRGQLADGLDDAGAEQVRRRYLEHLDSWADYMAAIEEDPLLLIEGRGAGFTEVINETADAFARALESELPADIDDAVERFAEGILDRGFRSFGEAQV
jgi:hypothetical protein